MKKALTFILASALLISFISWRTIAEEFWNIDGTTYWIDVNSSRTDENGDLVYDGYLDDERSQPVDWIICPGTGQKCTVIVKYGNVTASLTEWKTYGGPPFVWVPKKK